MVGRAGADPAGLLRVTATGPMVVGYQSRPHPRVARRGAKFTSYLKEQALDHILALREQKGQAHADVREQFIRCAKSLVRAGSAGGQPADRALGLTLELVTEADPSSLPPGQELPVRLTYLGRALAGVRVVAVNQRNPWDRLTATLGPGWPRPVPADRGRHVDGARRAHGPGAREGPGRLGQLLGVGHIRRCEASPRVS